MPHHGSASMLAGGMPSRRITQLDSVRGLALLGILIMNIGGFGLPKAAYMNPAYAGVPSFSDGLVWSLLSVFAQGTFLTMFAILFGASLQLLHQYSMRWNLSRLFWLALLGFCHSVYLWDGDILLTYGMVGIGAAIIIRSSSSYDGLMRTGILLYFIGLAILLWFGWITDNSMNAYWAPDAQSLAAEAKWKLAGGEVARQARLAATLQIQFSVIVQYGWELLGLMLLGAALIENGWLKGQIAPAVYRRQGWILLAISLLIQIPVVLLQWQSNWDFVIAGYYLLAPKELGSAIQGLAYLALWYGYGQGIKMSAMAAGLSVVGRMTLTNYLLQTLVCITLFYQFGWYQQWDRLSLLALVPFIWCINIGFSLLWLRFFRQGPMEWLWRRLTDIISIR
ncbi:DUF418 domain-containing protein YeiB [Pragia fontium]|nr:DUF418 domain-containing protein YeiB [Pragia fontium]